MPRIDVVAEGADVRGLEWQFRDHRDAVIALLPVERDVFVAEALETLQRKCVIDAFGFLQAQHVRPHRLEEFGDEVDAQPHRIDVPCGQGEAHGEHVSGRNRKDTPYSCVTVSPLSLEERPGRVSKDELTVRPSFEMRAKSALLRTRLVLTARGSSRA